MIRLFVALAIFAFGALLLWESFGQGMGMGMAEAIARLWPL